MDLYVICSHARTTYNAEMPLNTHTHTHIYIYIYIYMVLCDITFVKFPDDSPLRAETCSDIQCYVIIYVYEGQVCPFC